MGCLFMRIFVDGELGWIFFVRILSNVDFFVLFGFVIVIIFLGCVLNVMCFKMYCDDFVLNGVFMGLCLLVFVFVFCFFVFWMIL